MEAPEHADSRLDSLGQGWGYAACDVSLGPFGSSWAIMGFDMRRSEVLTQHYEEGLTLAEPVALPSPVPDSHATAHPQPESPEPRPTKTTTAYSTPSALGRQH